MTPDQLEAWHIEAARILALIEHANRDAFLVVHPDDEDRVKTLLKSLPESARPNLIASATVPHPGTAHYSRPINVDELTAPLAFLPMPRPVREALDTDLLELPDGRFLRGAEAAAFRRTRNRINTRLLDVLARKAESETDILDIMSETPNGRNHQ
jgi:hypothetical protein